MYFKLIKAVVWAVSATLFISGLVFAFGADATTPPLLKISANVMAQAGGAFFFALTVGWVIERWRDSQGYSALWEFSQEFRKSGVLAFYADRLGLAEQALEDAFERHNGGEVLMAGASLRLFLAPGLHFYPHIEKLLRERRSSRVEVRAVYSSPDYNHELPLRSFIEEFDHDGTFPKSKPSDWRVETDFDFDKFEKGFFGDRGIRADPGARVRVIQDLQGTRAGVTALRGVAKGVGNSIEQCESRFAPYCTVIVFPDRAFYTPNLLSSEVPVNMPMLVFHKSSDAYRKLTEYVNFLWRVGKCPAGSEASQNVRSDTQRGAFAGSTAGQQG